MNKNYRLHAHLIKNIKTLKTWCVNYKKKSMGYNIVEASFADTQKAIVECLERSSLLWFIPPAL